MARILTIGDPHFKQRGVTRYIQMSDEIIARAKEEEPDVIVVLGDTLHTHETANQSPYNMACKMIKGLSEISLVVLLIGNHDYSSNQQFLNENHFFNPLKEWKNVIVVDKVIQFTVGKHKFGASPYVYPGLFMKALLTKFTKEEIKELSCIFGHQEIRGVQMGSIKSEIGDIWEDDLPLLVTGHIHEFNILKDNVIYTGTPIQHNFGDGTDKGIYLFEFTDDNYSMRKLKVNVPLKKVYRVSVSELRELGVPENVEAKIIVVCTPEQYSAAEKEGLIQYFREYGATVIHEDTTIRQYIPDINTSQPFLEILYDKIKHDECLIDTYKDIFGVEHDVNTITTTTVRRRVIVRRKK